MVGKKYIDLHAYILCSSRNTPEKDGVITGQGHGGHWETGAQTKTSTLHISDANMVTPTPLGWWHPTRSTMDNSIVCDRNIRQEYRKETGNFAGYTPSTTNECQYVWWSRNIIPKP